MADIGFKMSEEDVSVLTATDEQILATSERSGLKITEFIATTLSISGGGTDPFGPLSTGSLTIPHGQPFVPLAFVFMEYNGAIFELPITANGVGGWGYYTDATNLVISAAAFLDPTSFDIYYSISETESAA